MSENTPMPRWVSSFHWGFLCCKTCLLLSENWFSKVRSCVVECVYASVRSWWSQGALPNCRLLQGCLQFPSRCGQVALSKTLWPGRVASGLLSWACIWNSYIYLYLLPCSMWRKGACCRPQEWGSFFVLFCFFWSLFAVNLLWVLHRKKLC